jgi:DNA-binding transcriptional regulator YiaG
LTNTLTSGILSLSGQFDPEMTTGGLLYMAQPEYERQGNRQIAVTNMSVVIADIRASYPHETFGKMADTIGVSVATVKTWDRTGRARQKVADKLIAAYPVPPLPAVETEGGLNTDKPVALSELFDGVVAGLLEIRKRLGV